MEVSVVSEGLRNKGNGSVGIKWCCKDVYCEEKKAFEKYIMK